MDNSIAPQWPSSGPLGVYFYNHFIYKHEVHYYAPSRSQLALKAGGVALIVIGQLPLSAISLKRQKNPIMNWTSAASNAFGFSVLNLWAYNKVMKNHSSTSFYINIFAGLGGIVSQIPLAYIAYFFNGRKIHYALLVLLGNAPSSIYSLKLMMDPKQKIKQTLIDQLSHNESAWIKCAKKTTGHEASSLLLKKIEVKKRNPCESIGFFGANGIGALLASTNVLFAGTFAFKFAQQWTQIKSMQYIIGGLAAGFNAALYFKGMMGTTARLYETAIHYFQGELDPYLSYQCKPKLTLTLFFVGLALNALSYATSVEVCEDSYSGMMREMMTYLVPSGLNVIIANALCELINELILMGLSKRGTDEQKLTVQLHYQLEALQNAIANSADEDVQVFKQALPAIERFCEAIK